MQWGWGTNYISHIHAKVSGSQRIRYPTTHSWVQQPFCPRDPWSQTMNRPGMRHRWPSVSPSPFSGKDGSHIFESNSQQSPLGGQVKTYSYWPYVIALSFCYVVAPSKSQFDHSKHWSTNLEMLVHFAHLWIHSWKGLLTLLVPSFTIWGGGYPISIPGIFLFPGDESGLISQ